MSTLEKVWLSVEKLIWYWANQYYRRRKSRFCDLDDLYQAGFLAVVDAIEGYNPELGKFTTYLRFHVLHRFGEASGRRGTTRRREHECLSLNASVDESGSLSFLDTLTDPAAEFEEDVLEREFARQNCAVLFEELNKMEGKAKQALLLTAWKGLSYREAASIMGVSIERVRIYRYTAALKLRRTRVGQLIGREYRHVSLSRFKTTHTSVVEEAVLWFERRKHEQQT